MSIHFVSPILKTRLTSDGKIILPHNIMLCKEAFDFEGDDMSKARISVLASCLAFDEIELLYRLYALYTKDSPSIKVILPNECDCCRDASKNSHIIYAGNNSKFSRDELPQNSFDVLIPVYNRLVNDYDIVNLALYSYKDVAYINIYCAKCEHIQLSFSCHYSSLKKINIAEAAELIAAYWYYFFNNSKVEAMKNKKIGKSPIRAVKHYNDCPLFDL